MEGRRLLIFPIFNEFQNGVSVVQTDVPDQGMKSVFGRMVIFQPLDRDLYEFANIRKQLELPEDCVEEIRYHKVVMFNFARAVVTFREAKEARATVLRCNRTSEHSDVCAIIARDLLQEISQMEEEIQSKSCINEMSQIVYYTDSIKRSESEFMRKLTALFSKICSNFSIKILDSKHGRASIKFPLLSQALAAEFAFCAHTRFVFLFRDSVYAQQDLKVRVSFIGLPEERFLGQQRTVCTGNKDAVELVFCNTMDCEGCLKETEERTCKFLNIRPLSSYVCEEREKLDGGEPNISEQKFQDETSSNKERCHYENSSDNKRCRYEMP